MNYFEHINSVHLDVLREIGNIGAGHAATSLSTLLDKKIEMTVPSVRVLSFDEMMESAGGPETVVASVFLRIEGKAPGSMFFVLSLSQAEYFIHQMTGEKDFRFENEPFSDMAVSALQELGNILSGSYLSSLSDFTGFNMYPSVPALSIDMAGAAISFGLLEVSHSSDYAIVIDTALSEEGRENGTIHGHFFLLPDPGSFEAIFTALGVRDHG